MAATSRKYKAEVIIKAFKKATGGTYIEAASSGVKAIYETILGEEQLDSVSISFSPASFLAKPIYDHYDYKGFADSNKNILVSGGVPTTWSVQTSYYEGGSGNVPQYVFCYLFDEQQKVTVSANLYSDTYLGTNYTVSTLGSKIFVGGVPISSTASSGVNKNGVPFIYVSGQVYPDQLNSTTFALSFTNPNISSAVTHYGYVYGGAVYPAGTSVGGITSCSSTQIQGKFASNRPSIDTRLVYQTTHSIIFQGVSGWDRSTTYYISNQTYADTSCTIKLPYLNYTAPGATAVSGKIIKKFVSGDKTCLPGGNIQIAVGTISTTYTAQFYTSFGPFDVTITGVNFSGTYKSLITSASVVVTSSVSSGVGSYEKIVTSDTGITISKVTFPADHSSMTGYISLTRTPTGYASFGEVSQSYISGCGASMGTDTVRTVQIILTPGNYPDGGSITLNQTFKAPYKVTVKDYHNSVTRKTYTGEVVLAQNMYLAVNCSYTIQSLSQKPVSYYDKFLGWSTKAKSNSADAQSFSSNYQVPLAVTANCSVIHKYVTGSMTGFDAIPEVIYEAWKVYENNVVSSSTSPLSIKLNSFAGSFDDFIDLTTVKGSVYYDDSNGAQGQTAGLSYTTSGTSTDCGITIKQVPVSAKKLYASLQYTFRSVFDGGVKSHKCTVSPSTHYGINSVVSNHPTITLTVTIPLIENQTVRYDTLETNNTATISQTLKAQASLEIAHYSYGIDGELRRTSINVGDVVIGNDMSVSFVMPSAKWAPYSKYDIFKGLNKDKKQSTANTGLTADKVGQTVSCSYTFQDWKDNGFEALQFYLFEAWSICEKIGNYSFIIKSPGGISKLSDAYTVTATPTVLFYNSSGSLICDGGVSTDPSSISSQYKVISAGLTNKSIFNDIDYIEFNIDYAESTFLKSRKKKTASINGPKNNRQDNSSDDMISVRYHIPTLIKEGITTTSTTLWISYSYSYEMIMNCYSYDGSKFFNKTTLEMTLSGAQLSGKFTAPARQSKKSDGYKAWWFFRGWSERTRLDLVDDNYDTNNNGKDGYDAQYEVGEEFTHTVQYEKGKNPVTEDGLLSFKIYETFRVGYGYIIRIIYQMDPEMKLVQTGGDIFSENGQMVQEFSKESEKSESSYSNVLGASKATRRGFNWKKWKAKNTADITSLSGVNFTVNLTDAAVSPESNRLKIKEAVVQADWENITWSRYIIYDKSTKKTVTSWLKEANGISPYYDKHTWKYDPNHEWQQYVLENNTFYLPIKTLGAGQDIITSDYYSLMEWNLDDIGEDDVTTIGRPYEVGKEYDFKELISTGWYNETLKQGTRDIYLHARWVEGTLVYIFNGETWDRAIPYIYDGSEWVRCIVY